MRTVGAVFLVLPLLLCCSQPAPKRAVSTVGPGAIPMPPAVGIWQATNDSPLPAIPPGPAAKSIEESMRHPTLNIRSNGTFELRVGYPTTGTWSQSGSTLTLKATSVSGVKGGSKPQDLTATLSDDNHTLTLAGERPLKFAKP